MMRMILNHELGAPGCSFIALPFLIYSGWLCSAFNYWPASHTDRKAVIGPCLYAVAVLDITMSSLLGLFSSENSSKQI